MLLRVLDERAVRGPGRAVDLGCGTGDNALALARRGFEVTGVDVAERAITQAQQKAAAAGVPVDFRVMDLTALDEAAGPFDLIVDRGLLMSLAGERARRRYTDTVERLASEGANVYQFQWVLPEPPRAFSPAWLAAKTHSVVLAPDELERRLGRAFSVEIVSRSVEASDDRAIRALGIRRVAKTSYWLSRRAAPAPGAGPRP